MNGVNISWLGNIPQPWIGRLPELTSRCRKAAVLLG